MTRCGLNLKFLRPSRPLRSSFQLWIIDTADGTETARFVLEPKAKSQEPKPALLFWVWLIAKCQLLMAVLLREYSENSPGLRMTISNMLQRYLNDDHKAQIFQARALEARNY